MLRQVNDEIFSADPFLALWRRQVTVRYISTLR